MKKMLINFFREPLNVCTCIGVAVATVVSILFLVLNGFFEPPTKEDFSKLHEQKDLIMQDFNNVYSFDNATISINKQEIIVKIVSEEEYRYFIQMTFSKDMDLISSEEISEKTGYKTYPVFEWLDKIAPFGVTLFVGVYGGMIIGYILYKIYKRIMSI